MPLAKLVGTAATSEREMRISITVVLHGAMLLKKGGMAELLDLLQLNIKLS
jgi:hypothetical protein